MNSAAAAVLCTCMVVCVLTVRAAELQVGPDGGVSAFGGGMRVGGRVPGRPHDAVGTLVWRSCMSV